MAEEMVTMKWAIEYADQNYKEGKLAGIKEVVEIVNNHSIQVELWTRIHTAILTDEWQTKLKEWGIKP